MGKKATPLEDILEDDRGEELPDGDLSDSGAADKSEPKDEDKPAKGESKGAATAPAEEADDELPEDLDGLKKALKAARGDTKAERKARQDLERRFDEVMTRLPKAQTPEAAEEIQDEIEALTDEVLFDADGMSAHLGRRDAVLLDRVAKLMHSRDVERLNTSSAIAAQNHSEDYAEAEAAFVEAAKEQPGLWAQARNHYDPGEYAYKVGKQRLAMRAMGDDPEAYRARLIEEERERIRAEVLAEVQGGEPERKPARKLPGKSLAHARGGGARTELEWTGSTPMQKILQ